MDLFLSSLFCSTDASWVCINLTTIGCHSPLAPCSLAQTFPPMYAPCIAPVGLEFGIPTPQKWVKTILRNCSGQTNTALQLRGSAKAAVKAIKGWWWGVQRSLGAPSGMHLGGPEGLGQACLSFLLSSSLEPLLWGWPRVFSIRFSKETVTVQGYQPLLPDFRVFSLYSWDEFISIILWTGKLRPRECKITQLWGKLPLAVRKTSFLIQFLSGVRERPTGSCHPHHQAQAYSPRGSPSTMLYSTCPLGPESWSWARKVHTLGPGWPSVTSNGPS